MRQEGLFVDKNAEAAAMQPATLLDLLKKLGIEFTLHRHPAVFSVGEADKVDTAIPGAHTRNLFLRDKRENMFLVTLMAHTEIDLAKLAGVIGARRLSFGSPERLMKYLGVAPGSVTPFSMANDCGRKVTLILDAEMMERAIVNYHPLINTMTVSLTPEGLLEFLDHHHIKPQIIDLTPACGE